MINYPKMWVNKGKEEPEFLDEGMINYPKMRGHVAHSPRKRSERLSASLRKLSKW